jgi:hypothetical protein
MTVEELQQRGYKFTVSHHRSTIEVRIDIEHVFSDTGVVGFLGKRLVGVCSANYRTDAMEAARMRACGHFVETRLA